MGAAQYFSASYAEAREKFRAAARGAGGTIESFVNTGVKGPAGEELATDVAYFGPRTASRLLVTCSATHGVEGFCGSGCQVGAIGEGVGTRLPGDVAVVVIHAINPHGFAHQRRVTEDNVDLNRNFPDFARLPANPAYDRVHDLLIPRDWDGPARAEAERGIQAFIAANGMPAFQAAVSGGQYSHDDGLFFGGRQPTWSHRTFRAITERYMKGRKRLAFIDYHTGLGPEGYGEPIHPGPVDSAGFRTARAWFGADVTSPEGGTSTSAVVMGTLKHALDADLKGIEMGMIALEYGTKSVPEVMTALRADHWLYAHGDVGSAQGQAIKAQIRAAFYVETPSWKEKVLARSLEMTAKALAALAA